jgi:hypothetical protein
VRDNHPIVPTTHRAVGVQQFQGESRSPNEKDCPAADGPVRKHSATRQESPLKMCGSSAGRFDSCAAPPHLTLSFTITSIRCGGFVVAKRRGVGLLRVCNRIATGGGLWRDGYVA